MQHCPCRRCSVISRNDAPFRVVPEITEPFVPNVLRTPHKATVLRRDVTHEYVKRFAATAQQRFAGEQSKIANPARH